MRPRRKQIPPYDFIKAWQLAPGREALARKLKMSMSAIRQREKRYRKKRVPLKDLPFIETWQWLRRFAKELNPSVKRR